VRAAHVDVQARTASDDEKPRLWQIVNAVWPNYDVYQSRTDRVIPVVVLTPSG
jgi:deazaflavin-dependent oxidoreductase (nitroreductase family)